MEEKIKQFTEILKDSENIVFFSGAGVSAGSNIPDFKMAEGMFSESLNSFFTPEQMMSYTFFRKYPKEFYKFYKSNLVYLDAKPNDCHIALAELEKMGKLKAIITQNMDGLHQAAGSKKVYELNGSVHRNYCKRCGAPYNAKYIMDAEGVPICTKCDDIIKPDVVLLGECFDNEIMEYIIYYTMKADTLIVGGTSLAVHPAAGIIKSYFEGKNIVVINENPMPADSKANLVIHDDVVKVMKEAVENLNS